MKKIRTLVGIGISVIFLYLVFRKVDMAQVWAAMKTMEAVWLLPAILIYFIGIWVRTSRWVILMKPVAHGSTRRFFPIYIISYMANNILPLRIGDIYRAYIVGKKEKVSKSASLVTIGVERIFDGLTMLFLLFTAVMFFPVSDPRVKLTIQFSAAVFLTTLAVCYVVVLNKSWARRLFDFFLGKTPERFQPRLTDLFDNFYQGLDSLRGGKDIFLVSILSLGTWLLEAACYWVVLWGFGFRGDFHVAVSTMALVNLMIIIPAAPGYFGPFELACIIILGNSGYGSITHFTRETATAFALILHVVVQWIPSTLLGLYYMWGEHISFREVSSDSLETSAIENGMAGVT